MREAELVVIGGGPAGLAAAVSAAEQGVRDILVLDRNPFLGGILQQCIHNGFGLHRFGEELTGPEYAGREIRRAAEHKIPCLTGTMVTDLSPDRVVTAVNPESGEFRIRAGAVVLAMGCRERPRGALSIPGTRPAGIYTAGTAQRYVNLMGVLPGRRVVILGSGDIGLIMARRMTLEGAKVEAVCELLPYSGGLTRNLVQCLQDFGIPLLLSHTVTGIEGGQRLTAVTVSEVDGSRRPIPGTERRFPCDTLLLSVGLIPENELSKGAGVALDPATGGPVTDQFRQTSVPGVFACGNVLHVHDLVDYVSEEAALCGRSAAAFLRGGIPEWRTLPLRAGAGIRYVLPQKLTLPLTERADLFFRVREPVSGAILRLRAGGRVIREIRKRRMAPGEMERLKLEPGEIGEESELTLELG